MLVAIVWRRPLGWFLSGIVFRMQCSFSLLCAHRLMKISKIDFNTGLLCVCLCSFRIFSFRPFFFILSFVRLFAATFWKWKQWEKIVCYKLRLDNILSQNAYVIVWWLRSFDTWAVLINLSCKINDFDGSFVLMLIACGKCSTWICSSYYKTKAHLMPLTKRPSPYRRM